MKKYLLGLGLSLFEIAAMAQSHTADIQWGELHKMPDINFNHIIHSNPQHFFTFGYTSEPIKYVLTKYDFNTLKEHEKYVYDKFEYKGHEAFYEYSRKWNGDFLMFFSSFNPDVLVKTLLVRKVNRNGEMGPIIPVSEMKGEESEDSGYNTLFSGDSTKMMIYTAYNGKRKDKETFNLNVYDAQLKELWSEEVVLRYNEKDFRANRVEVSNKGNVYVLGFLSGDRSSDSDELKLFKFPTYRGNISEISPSLQGNYLNSARIIPDIEEGKMALVGFYSEESGNNLRGIFSGIVDQKTFRLRPLTLTPVSAEFLEEFTSPKRAARGVELSAFAVEEAFKNDRGGITIISERIYDKYYYDRETNKLEYSKHWNEYIAIFDIDLRGDILDFSVVHKRQLAKNQRDYLSYQRLEGTDCRHFLYNDQENTVERLKEGKDPADMYSIRKSTVTMASVNEKNEIEYQTLFKNGDMEAYFIPYHSRAAGPDKGLLVNIKGQWVRFGKITINNGSM